MLSSEIFIKGIFCFFSHLNINFFSDLTTMEILRNEF